MKRCVILLLLISLWLPVVSGQSDIQATSLPPLTEESWTFADNGNVYYVGKMSGKVTVARGGRPEPRPDDIKPPPVVKKGVKWFSLVVDLNDAGSAAYRTDTDARQKLSKAGIEYRTYVSTESDIDSLRLREVIEKTGLPAVVTQDKDGNVIESRKVTSGNEWAALVRGVLP